MEWLVALGLLVLPLVVLIASLHAWLDRWSIANSLAYETARAAAIAPDRDSGLDVVAVLERGAESQLQSGSLPCPYVDGCLRTRLTGGAPARGERLHAEVSVWMPGLVVPPFGDLAGFWLSVGHDEIIDPYRSLP